MMRRMMMAVAVLAAAASWGRSLSYDLNKMRSDAASPRTRAVLLGSGGVAADGSELRSFRLGTGAAAAFGELAPGDELSFALFDDVAVTLTLTERMDAPLGGDVFLASVAGYDGVASAVVVRNGDGLTIDVQDFARGKVYRVLSASDGVKVAEYELSGCSCGSCADLAGEESAEIAANVSPGEGTPPVAGDVSPYAEIDVLVAYDEGAKSWVATNGGITNFAVLAVHKMNTALANTGLDEYYRFRLVGVTTVATSTTSLDDGLDNAKKAKGAWSSIAEVRDEVGADIVTVLIDTGSSSGTTGLGYSLESTSNFASFANSAYNCCAIRSVASSHTMTHEVGHNMGAGHSRDQTAYPGPQASDYASGYYFTGNDGRKYHTIMAYYYDGHGNTYSLAPYFSSPEYTYQGVPVGNADNDNTRVLRLTCSGVAAFRSTTTPAGIGDDDITEPIQWLTTRAEAFAAAKAQGKKIFLISGRETCGNTLFTRDTSCETAGVKRRLLDGFVCWFNNCDTQYYESSRYFSGFDVGTALPFIAVIDADADATLLAEGGPHDADEVTDLLKRSSNTVSFWPASGTEIGSSLDVQLSCGNAAAEIRYTLDGSAPGPSSKLYSGKITLSAATTIRAVAVTGGKCGPVGIANYPLAEIEWTIRNGVLTAVNLHGHISVTIPSSVKEIDPEVFRYSTDLKSVTIPGSCKKIGRHAFFCCTSLATVDIKEGVKEIGDLAFCGCEAMTGISLPNSLETLGAGVFDGCTRLREIDIPDGVPAITKSLFYDCPALERVSIGSGVATVGREAFGFCGSLVTFEVSPDNPYLSVRDGMLCDKAGTRIVAFPPGIGGSFEIPPYITAIAPYAFWSCEKLTSLEVPDSVEEIGEAAFGLCDGLGDENDLLIIRNRLFRYTRNSYTASPVHVEIPYGVTDIEPEAFHLRSAPTSIEIPNSVTNIGESAFLCSQRIKDVVIPDSVVHMGESAFSHMFITNVTVGASVTDIGDSTFYLCGKLEQVTFLGNVTNIGSKAFADCPKLQSLELPESLTSIRYWAFYNCSNLTEITIPKNVSEIGAWAFENCTRLTTMRLPVTLKDLSKARLFGDASTPTTISYYTFPCTVTFDATGGSVDEASREVDCLSQIGGLPTPERPGWVFNGWWTAQTGGAKASAATVAERDTTLYAHWLRRCAVTFDANGGVGEMESVEFLEGEAVALPPNTFSRGGHVFMGWAIRSDGAAMYGDRARASFAGDTTLYAEWLPGFTVTYDANGGTGDMADVHGHVGESVTIANNSFQRKGYIFLGWALSPSGEIEYRAGDVLQPGGDMMLYAIWECLLVDISFDPCGGVLDLSTPFQGTRGEAIGELPQVASEGRSFLGWWTAPAGGTRVDENTVATSELTRLYAHWLEYDANGGTLLEEPPAVFNGGEMPFAVRKGRFLDGWWTGKTGGDRVTADMPVAGDMAKVYAHWSKDVAFVTGGDSAWAQTGDGTWKSGRIDKFQNSWLEAKVYGAGEISFRWKAPSSSYYGHLAFELDGVEQENICQVGDWVEKKVTVPGQGVHVLKWNFYGDSWLHIAGGHGWLDAVSWKASAGSGDEEQEPPSGGETGGGGDDEQEPPSGGETGGGGDDEQEPPSGGETGGSGEEEQEPPSGGETGGDGEEQEEPPPGGETGGEEDDAAPPRINSEVAGVVSASAATVFDGCVYGADGSVAATFQVKVSKAKAGAASAKAKLTLTGLSGKANVSGAIDLATGRMEATLKDGRKVDLVFGEDAVAGTIGSGAADGSRNIFSSKDASDKGTAAAVMGKWNGSRIGVAWQEEDGLWSVVGASVGAKGKVGVRGFFADGTAISAKSQLVVGEEWCAIPVIGGKKRQLAFMVWLPAGTGEPIVTGLDGAVAGRVYIGERAVFRLADAAAAPGETLLGEFLPREVAFSAGERWTFPAAGAVKLDRKTGEVLDSKNSRNPSALKLSYAPKTGLFKGSFKIFATTAQGRLRKYSAKVNGVVCGGCGFGCAIVKGIGAFAVRIE